MANHLFDAIRAAATPEAVFIETAEGRRWTYGDMIRLSGQMAVALQGLSVQPGDRVAVQVEKSPEALMLYLACLRAGAIYLPLNTAYTLAELDYFIGDAEPRLVVVDPRAREGVAQIAAAYGCAVETLDATGGGSLLQQAGG
jgi:malonyl-CoA/methylmalonyl-CoA synthetase